MGSYVSQDGPAQWSSNASLQHQPLEGLFGRRWLGPTSRVSDLVGLGGAWDNSFPDDAAAAWGTHFENHEAVAINNSNTSVTKHDKIIFLGQAKSPAGPGSPPRPLFSIRWLSSPVATPPTACGLLTQGGAHPNNHTPWSRSDFLTLTVHWPGLVTWSVQRVGRYHPPVPGWGGDLNVDRH